MQLVLTCANYSGIYRWNDTAEFCEYGCLDGSCVIISDNCTDVCSLGDTSCAGEYIVNCTLGSDGCYDWSPFNMSYCKNGCFLGRCFSRLSQCSSQQRKCSDNYIMNCTQTVDGAWIWTRQEFCEYGCEHTYISGTVANVSCMYQGDTHGISSSIRRAQHEVGFVFEPVLLLAYLLGTLLLIGFLCYSIGNFEFAGYLYIIASIAGTFPFGIVPFYITLIITAAVILLYKKEVL
jgi:hypothetical protein